MGILNSIRNLISKSDKTKSLDDSVLTAKRLHISDSATQRISNVADRLSPFKYNTLMQRPMSRRGFIASYPTLTKAGLADNPVDFVSSGIQSIPTITSTIGLT